MVPRPSQLQSTGTVPAAVSERILHTKHTRIQLPTPTSCPLGLTPLHLPISPFVFSTGPRRRLAQQNFPSKSGSHEEIQTSP